VARRIVRGTRSSSLKNQVWTSVLLDTTVDDTPVVAADIVQRTDWEVTGSAEKATLMRVRGWLSFAVQGKTDPLTQALFMGIVVINEDAFPANPDTVTFYTSEDVLWTYGIQFAGGLSTATETPTSYQVPVDVKSMRRIGNNQDVRLVMLGTTARVILVAGVLRALVRRGGN